MKLLQSSTECCFGTEILKFIDIRNSEIWRTACIRGQPEIENRSQKDHEGTEHAYRLCIQLARGWRRKQHNFGRNRTSRAHAREIFCVLVFAVAIVQSVASMPQFHIRCFAQLFSSSRIPDEGYLASSNQRALQLRKSALIRPRTERPNGLPLPLPPIK